MQLKGFFDRCDFCDRIHTLIGCVKCCRYVTCFQKSKTIADRANCIKSIPTEDECLRGATALPSSSDPVVSGLYVGSYMQYLKQYPIPPFQLHYNGRPGERDNVQGSGTDTIGDYTMIGTIQVNKLSISQRNTY